MAEQEITLVVIVMLSVTGFAAGFVDSIAGGGGLISLPALLSVGVPPHIALGTNKLQSMLGASFATANYARQGLITRDGTTLGVAVTAGSSFAGAFLVSRVSADLLVRMIPWLLAAIFVYVWVSPKIGHAKKNARIGVGVFYAFFGGLLGLYDGFFGPGTGSFWTIAHVLLLGFTLPHAIGHTKVMNLTSNAAALVFFASHGSVAWIVGLCMGGANIAGALIGSTLAIKKGAGFIRIFFLLAVGATIARLVWRSVS